MKNRKAYYIVFCLFLIGTLTRSKKASAQQNVQFTQYIFNSLSVNPAYAGYKEEWFAQLGLRSQWVNMDRAPKTGQISIDGLLKGESKRHGVGLQLTADKLGPQAATSLYANYAFRLRLDEMDTKRLSFGIGLGINQNSLDGTLLQSGPGTEGNGNDDSGLSYGKESEMIPDLRFGIYYASTSWYAGLSVMDLLQGDMSKSIFNSEGNVFMIPRKRHLYFIAGTILDLQTDLKLRPSILVKEDFKGPTSVDVNAMFIFGEQFWLGGGFRTGLSAWKKNIDKVDKLSKLNSFSGVAQFFVNPHLRVGYSYDHILSKLSSFQNGTHEISIGLTFPQKNKRILTPRYF